MAEDVVARRVAANAAAAGVAVDEAGAERIARAVSPVLTRFADAGLKLAMEVEPASFVAAQRRDRAV